MRSDGTALHQLTACLHSRAAHAPGLISRRRLLAIENGADTIEVDWVRFR